MPSDSSGFSSFNKELAQYLPHLSVDCVVFGFHNSDLKLLLLKWKNASVWQLPVGYIRNRESVDAAAQRVLRSRTGLRSVHLSQFHAFGGLKRKESDFRRCFESQHVETPPDAWPTHRVVSIGYYALVDFLEVRPRPDGISDAASWFPINGRPRLAFDHDEIVQWALDMLRSSLDSPKAAATLLPERFTMPELHRLHEAVLDCRLDRRNFQKRMLERDLVERLPERRIGGAHRAPYLYRFKTHRLDAGFHRRRA